MTLILTYHAVEEGPAPICIEPTLFAEHIGVIVDSGCAVITVAGVVRAIGAGSLSEPAVAITFDDGCASVVEHAAPLLEAHGLPATIYCVAGHTGGSNNWPTQAGWAPPLRLASAGDLRALVARNWEIGSHGVDHAPLDQVDEEAARREIVESRELLADMTGADVTTFAWPYGVQPSPAAAALIASTYDAACAPGPRVATGRDDLFALPRVDAHYVRDPATLRRAIDGALGRRLAVRRVAAQIRRRFRKDYVSEHVR